MSNAISTVGAVIAVTNANEAHKDRCKTEELVFNPKTATLTEKRSYADCINYLYPNAPSGNDILAIKFLLAVAFIGFLFGLANGYDIDDRLSNAFTAFIVSPLVVSIIGLFCYGIYFLFFG